MKLDEYVELAEAVAEYDSEGDYGYGGEVTYYDRISNWESIIEAILKKYDQTKSYETEEGCVRCGELGHHPRCDEHLPSIGDLLGSQYL